MTTPEPAVGRRIRKLRTDKSLSQREISSDGVTEAYVSRIEKGSSTPSYDALIKIAEKLDTTALFLRFGDDKTDCPICGRHA